MTRLRWSVDISSQLSAMRSPGTYMISFVSCSGVTTY
jgi:hypothetical protein